MIKPKKSDLSLISGGSDKRSTKLRGESHSASNERKKKSSHSLLDEEVKDSKEAKPKKQARISDSSFPQPQSGGGVKKSMDLALRKRKQSILSPFHHLQNNVQRNSNALSNSNKDAINEDEAQENTSSSSKTDSDDESERSDDDSVDVQRNSTHRKRKMTMYSVEEDGKF